MIKISEKIVYKPITEIIPYENNARENEAAVDALVKAIPVMGFNVPIVLDRDNVIVKGHSRYEALKRLGIDLVPCIVIEGTPEEIADERLADNKISELSSWDEEKQRYELREMVIDLSSFGIEIPKLHLGGAGAVPVTEKKIQMDRDRLIGSDMKVSSEKKTLIEVHCPECGGDFFANLDEVMKYVD